MYYRLSSSRDLYCYRCPPEIVVFDNLTKTTLLLPSPEAKIYSCFEGSENKMLTEEYLKNSTDFLSDQTDPNTLFYDSLSTLIQLNLIESIE